MATPLEVAAMAIDGFRAEVTDLRAQLQQAQGERDRAVNELVAEVGKGHEWDEKYDAAIERAERAEAQARQKEER